MAPNELPSVIKEMVSPRSRLENQTVRPLWQHETRAKEEDGGGSTTKRPTTRLQKKRRKEVRSYGDPHTAPAVGIRTDVRPIGKDGGGR